MKPSNDPLNDALPENALSKNQPVYEKICEMVGETLSPEQAKAFCRLFRKCSNRCESCQIAVENVDCMIAAYRKAADSVEEDSADVLHEKLRCHLEGQWKAVFECGEIA